MEVGDGVHALLYNVYALKRLLTHRKLVMRSLPSHYTEAFVKKQGFAFLRTRYLAVLLEKGAGDAPSYTQLRLLKYLAKAMSVVLKTYSHPVANLW